MNRGRGGARVTSSRTALLAEVAAPTCALLVPWR